MKYRTFAASVVGANHIDNQKPCQDSSGIWELGEIQAVALADGHGSADCFRSEIGARLAVEVAFEQVKNFCREVSPPERFSDFGIKNFKYSLKNAWLDAIKEDWQNNSVDEDFSPAAYGTTLILAVSIGTQILILQIGDGTCVTLLSNGKCKIPVPPDEDNFLNFTSSLCEIDADKKFRHAVLECDKEVFPVAIFLSTDGLDNCYQNFGNEKFLYNLYSEVIMEKMLESGFEETEKELRADFLPAMSENASKDDISLAYMTADIELLEKFLQAERNKNETADSN